MQGWIKLHRQLTENELYFSERFTKMQAWLDMLLLASHKKNMLYIKGIEINLNPGELCYSQRTLSCRWRWNERTVKKFLEMLQKKKMIQYRKNNVTTVITILNWNEYQNSTSQNTSQNTYQTQHGIQTNKNENNDKNKKKVFLKNLPAGAV